MNCDTLRPTVKPLVVTRGPAEGFVQNWETTSGEVEAEVFVSCTVLEQTRQASRRAQKAKQRRARTLYVFEKLLSKRSLKPRELQLACRRLVERHCTRQCGTKLLPPSTTRAAGFAASTNISNASMSCHGLWQRTFRKSTGQNQWYGLFQCSGLWSKEPLARQE